MLFKATGRSTNCLFCIRNIKVSELVYDLIEPFVCFPGRFKKIQIQLDLQDTPHGLTRTIVEERQRSRTTPETNTDKVSYWKVYVEKFVVWFWSESLFRHVWTSPLLLVVNECVV